MTKNNPLLRGEDALASRGVLDNCNLIMNKTDSEEYIV